MRIDGHEYNPGPGPTGVLVSQANLDVTGTGKGPPITPAGSDELYSFYGFVVLMKPARSAAPTDCKSGKRKNIKGGCHRLAVNCPDEEGVSTPTTTAIRTRCSPAAAYVGVHGSSYQ